MEEQCSPLDWAYYYQEKGTEEYMFSRLDIEAVILTAHEEISRKDDEILQLKDLLANILRERDEIQAKCQALVLENQLLLQQVAQMNIQHSNCATSDDENMSLSPSNCDYSTTWSPAKVPPSSSSSSSDKCWSCEKSLPQNGKFLQAVMEAGPLLHTLLLSGPLPRWQHPPPPLNTTDIPPVAISPNTATPTSAQHSSL